jgi:hypothetical protein
MSAERIVTSEQETDHAVATVSLGGFNPRSDFVLRFALVR